MVILLTFLFKISTNSSSSSSARNNYGVRIWHQLGSERSIKFKAKIISHPNARLGSMNICKVIAQLPNSDDKKIVKINEHIPDPFIKGQ